jgi:hypothetical protein
MLAEGLPAELWQRHVLAAASAVNLKFLSVRGKFV